jgi:hypothetical protein
LEIVVLSSRIAPVAASIAAVGFVCLAGFQVALTSGAPWGRAAWGGGHDRLPLRLRIASAISAVVWLAAALLVLGRAGFSISPIPADVARWGTWVLVGLLGLGALLNLASSSRWERFLMSPIALLLSTLCLVAALGP